MKFVVSDMDGEQMKWNVHTASSLSHQQSLCPCSLPERSSGAMDRFRVQENLQILISLWVPYLRSNPRSPVSRCWTSASSTVSIYSCDENLLNVSFMLTNKETSPLPDLFEFTTKHSMFDVKIDD